MVQTGTKTLYEEAHEAILCGAEKVRFPHIEELRSCLTTEVPADQFAALLESLRQLARHTGKEPLITQSAIFRFSVNASATLERQKACVRSVAKEVPILVALMTKQEDGKVAGGGTGEGQRKQGADNGDQRPLGKGCSDQQWLHIVYAPQLRHRLLEKRLNPRCQVLGVDLFDESRYPHNMEVAKQMSEQEIAAAFADLERMTMQLLNAPSLHDAVRLNESINDARQEGFDADLLTHVDNSLQAEAQTLLNMKDDRERLRTMMNEDSVTATLVASLLEAYARIIKARASASAARSHLQPARAGSGGGQLPKVGPVRSGSPARPSHYQPARGPTSVPGTTQGEPDVDENLLKRVVSDSIAPLDRKITALDQKLQHVTPEKMTALLALADNQPTAAEVIHLRQQVEQTEQRGQEEQRRLSEDKDRLEKEKKRLEDELAKRPAAVIESPETQRLREENVRLRMRPAPSNTGGVLAFVLGCVGIGILLFAAFTTINSGSLGSYWAQTQPVQQQSEPAASVPTTFDFSDL